VENKLFIKNGLFNKINTSSLIAKAKTHKIIKFKLTSLAVMILWL